MAMSAVQHQEPPMQIDAARQLADRDSAYGRLMAVAEGGRNGHAIATMLASWSVGESVLPARMGLSVAAYQALFNQYYPGILWDEDVPGKGALDFERLPERGDLIDLIADARAGQDESEVWLAEIIAAACMGMDHLWRDMGLWSRNELSELMQRNFPSLAQRNDRDMKWKKFLYKQLCEQEGVYVCRAPSCDVCSDYLNCFGPED